MKFMFQTAVTLSLAAALSSTLSAQSGATLRARIDVESIALDAMVNPRTQTLEATAQIKFVPLDANIQTVTFELNDALTVKAASDSQGQPLTPSRGQDSTIRFTFPSALARSQPVTIKVVYEGRFSGQEESPIAGIRFASIRPEYSYLLYPARWFPVNDYTADRYTGEFRVTVEGGFKVVGGGIDTRTGDVTTIRYTQPGFGGSIGIVKDEPQRVSSAGATTAVYFRDGKPMAQAYGEETGKQLAYYAGQFGLAPSTSLALVETDREAPAGYSAPGVIFLSPGTIGKALNPRGLANQMARQWWGVLISAATRNHLWITNGLARYGELMYLESLSGPSVMEVELRDIYTEALTVDNPPLIQSARLEDYSPEFWALTGGKGAAVVNMLRNVLGDEKFFRLLKTVTEQYANKSINTEQFRRVADQVAGQDIGYFFIEWIESSGAPEFKLEYTVFRTTKGFRVVGKVAQDLDTFRMPVELKIETEGNPETKTIEVSGVASEFATDTFGKPTKMSLDPNRKVLRWDPATRVSVAIRRGEQFAEINDYAEALREYQRALEVNRNNSLAHYRVAEIFFLQNNYQSAANEFRQALDGDNEPKWTEVWSRIHLGRIFDVTGQRERAVNEYNLAIRTRDNTQGAQEEAARHLKEPYKRAISSN